MSNNVPSGLTPFRNINLGLTAVAVKVTAGQVYWYFITNQHATASRYVHFYDLAQASVVVGTTPPIITLAIPVGAHSGPIEGLNFDVAITIAGSDLLAATGAPDANDIVINLGHT